MLLSSSSPPCGTAHHVVATSYLPQLDAVALPASTPLDKDKLRLSQDVPSRSHWTTTFNTSGARDCFCSLGFPMCEVIWFQDPHLGSSEQPIIDSNEAHRSEFTQGWDIFGELCRGGGGFDKATKIVDAMEKQGIMVYSVVFSRLLQQCIREKNLLAGRHVHNLIVGSGCEADFILGSSLVHMFARCGSLAEANQWFYKLRKRNVYSWTAMIEAYTELGQNEQAIQVYYELERLNTDLDGYVFVSVLKACSNLLTLEHGKHIHTCIMESGLDYNLFVGSALINMYAKCGGLNEAYLVFDRLSKGNVITWSALIAGYVEHGHSKDALQLFHCMEREGIEPNEVTYMCILKACSSLAALEQGKYVQAQIIQRGFESDLFVGNSLIDMYSKCGSLSDALVMFNRMVELDVVTWSALIAGYAKHSNYDSALHLFQSMQKMNIRPNGITYLSLLSACSHVGHFDEGCSHFKCMIDHCLWPTLEHYNALVDILGRAGYLDEAVDLLETLPFGPNYVGWVSVLDSCRLSGNVCRGKQCFNNIVSMEGRSALGYVLMSSIYAHAGMWEDFKLIEELRRCANLWKKPAKAFIEVNNHVHDFIVGDSSHPRAFEIYGKLRSLDSKMREIGYSPLPVMEYMPEEDKEDALCGHSEKLAIAFGLISTPQGTTIRVAKNLRVCTDCHNVAKIISRIELREIIITDAYRIHHFKDGACCCKDKYT